MLLAALTLQYEFSRDIARLDGHARNFALLALLVALGVRLQALRPRWRYAIGALVFALITWPTVGAPVRTIGLAIGQGTQLTNARPEQQEADTSFTGRHVLERFTSERIAAYIQNHTPVDARVLSPSPTAMTVATGRPNASGLVWPLHYSYTTGPEYEDAIRYLEPAAIQRLGVTYVHTTAAWMAELPARAARWLADPDLFELLIRDGSDALYRVRPAFVRLDAPPTDLSFEGLRQAVPPAATVYLPPGTEQLAVIRAAAVLSHAQLFGFARFARSFVHMRTSFEIESLGDQTPDFVVMATQLAPSALAPGAREPIWWNNEIAVYALGGTSAPVTPPRTFSVQLSDVRVDHGRISFTVTSANREPEQAAWTGQDWLVVATDASPWAFPRTTPADEDSIAQWFAGQIPPEWETARHAYLFDPHAAHLEVKGYDGRFAAVASAGSSLSSGVWTLAVRLRHDWSEAALIPVMRIVVSDAGDVSYDVYEGALSARPVP